LPGFKTKTFVLFLALLVAWHELDKRACAKEKPPQRSRTVQGKSLFIANGCLDCHTVGKKGCEEGVQLDDVGKRRTREFLKEHLRDPESHVKKNKDAFHGDPSLMPNPNLSEKEVQLIVDYLVTLKR